MPSKLEPEDASFVSERPLTRSEYSPATRPSCDAGDRAALVTSRSGSRTLGRSSRAPGRSGWGSALREIRNAEIQAASLRLESDGVSARQLRAVAAELGGKAWRKADDIAVAMEARSQRAFSKAAFPGVFTGATDVSHPWILAPSQTEQPTGTSEGSGTAGMPSSRVPDRYRQICGVRRASGIPCGAECWVRWSEL